MHALHAEAGSIGVESVFLLLRLVVVLFHDWVELHVVDQRDSPFTLCLARGHLVHAKSSMTESSLRLQRRPDLAVLQGLFLVVR